MAVRLFFRSASRRELLGLAAVLFFAFVQTVALAHASSPEALQPDHGSCVLCLSAHRDRNAIASESIVVEVALEPFAAPVAVLPVGVVRVEQLSPPARAPPAF